MLDSHGAHNAPTPTSLTHFVDHDQGLLGPFALTCATLGVKNPAFSRGMQKLNVHVCTTSSARKLIFATALVFLAATGCVAPPQPVSNRNSELTQGNVQLNLKVGSTTKAEVLETFGAPNITTRDGAGREVWTYQRAGQAAQSSSQSGYWTVILAGQSSSASGFESTSRMMTLIIKFDANDIVDDFRSRSSNF